jgi:hypothetical protein
LGVPQVEVDASQPWGETFVVDLKDSDQAWAYDALVDVSGFAAEKWHWGPHAELDSVCGTDGVAFERVIAQSTFATLPLARV